MNLLKLSVLTLLALSTVSCNMLTGLNEYAEGGHSTMKTDILLKGLTKSTLEEHGLEITDSLTDGENIPVYLPSGRRIRGFELVRIMYSNKYMADPYVNTDNEIKAYLLRVATEEERKELKAKLKQLQEEEQN